MTLRRLVTAASTFVVVVVLALGVQVAQLTTVSDRVECCCPDPDRCKCPDHKPDHSEQATIKACHKQGPKAVASTAMAFLPPAQLEASAPEVVLSAPFAALPAPHPAPVLRRPDAPS